MVTAYDAGMDRVVLVPVKSFADAKARLASVLSPSQREELARWMAARVLAAASGVAVYVACDDQCVADWATDHGAKVLWRPGVGLNRAVNSSIDELRDLGVDHVIVAHGDLPCAHDLPAIACQDTIVLVPDARGDGTNVAALPTSFRFDLAYGPWSFERHRAQAITNGLPLAVRRDALLCRDIDTATDLSHPLVQEVLPPWMPTIPASRPCSTV